MKYNIRECPLKFYLDFGGCDGSQTCSFEIDGQKHTWWLSQAMGDLFGSMLDAVYGLFIEVMDHSPAECVGYEHNNPDNRRVITAVTAFSSEENEGQRG